MHELHHDVRDRVPSGVGSGSSGKAAPTRSRFMSAWLWSACFVQTALILGRGGALADSTTPFWALALPGFLAGGQGAWSLLAPVLLVLVLLGVFRARTQKGGSRAAHWYSTVPLAALVPAILVALLPDRTGFMGDFLIRQGAVLAQNYAGTFPQSLPLDRWIQGELVPALGADPTLRSLDGARWMGWLACIATTVIGVRAIRNSGLLRPWSDLTILILCASGYLCVFTGSARDTVEFLPVNLLLLTSLHMRIRGHSPWSILPELAMAALLMLHRTAVCMVPIYLYATIQSSLATSSRPRLSVRWWVGAAILGLVTLVMMPRIVHLGLSFDLPMNAEWLVSRRWAGHPLADASLLWDVVNAIVMLAPAAPLGLLVFGLRSGGERWFCLLAVAGWLPLLLVTPHQGVYRDYDAYAGLALTLGYCAVLGLSSGVTYTTRLGRWAFALTAISSLQAALGLLLVSSSAASTEERVRQGILLARPVQQREKSLMHEYLGANAERRGLWKEAALRFGAAAELVPAPVRVIRAGRAAAYASDWTGAREWFGKLIGRDSSSVIGWCGYSASSWMVGDTTLAREAEARLAQLSRSPNERLVALRFLAYSPVLDSSGRLRRAVERAAR